MTSKYAKYYAVATNDQGASLDVVLPMSERRHSIRAFEDAARYQLGSGWTVHIMGVIATDNWYQATDEIKSFRIR